MSYYVRVFLYLMCNVMLSRLWGFERTSFKRKCGQWGGEWILLVFVQVQVKLSLDIKAL